MRPLSPFYEIDFRQDARWWITFCFATLAIRVYSVRFGNGELKRRRPKLRLSVHVRYTLLNMGFDNTRQPRNRVITRALKNAVVNHKTREASVDGFKICM